MSKARMIKLVAWMIDQDDGARFHSLTFLPEGVDPESDGNDWVRMPWLDGEISEERIIYGQG